MKFQSFQRIFRGFQKSYRGIWRVYVSSGVHPMYLMSPFALQEDSDGCWGGSGDVTGVFSEV